MYLLLSTDVTTSELMCIVVWRCREIRPKIGAFGWLFEFIRIENNAEEDDGNYRLCKESENVKLLPKLLEKNVRTCTRSLPVVWQI